MVVFSRDGSSEANYSFDYSVFSIFFFLGFTLACEDLQIVVYSCCLANKIRKNDDEEEGGGENQSERQLKIDFIASFCIWISC